MIREINLCLVNACNANCAFCPRRGHEIKGEKFMQVELVDEILNQIRSDEFQEKHDLVGMHIWRGHFDSGRKIQDDLVGFSRLPYVDDGFANF